MTRYVNLAEGWKFRRLDPSSSGGAWIDVDLPHTPFISDLNGTNHWFGDCEYRRTISHTPACPGESIALYIGAAMQSTRAFVNGVEIARHEGGFLPFEIDLTSEFSQGASLELLLRLDNRENADIPPGKPYNELDFCWYGGLYRNAELRIRPPLHITEAISAGVPAGGGVFIQTLAANLSSARLRVLTDVRNWASGAESIRVKVDINFSGATLASAISEIIAIAPDNRQAVALEPVIAQPVLWSPHAPHMYDVIVSLTDADGRLLDQTIQRYGIRRIAFSRCGGFTINDRRVRLRGTNRHQEMPCVGYAVPRAAQFRDAIRIKQAGFDYVRLSHYPQSPDFLDACDEVGLVVMNCIPGWQFLGGDRFVDASFENVRVLIRRDRNHACVVLWELSLNETPIEAALASRLHTIGHEEYPGDQMFTCGWVDHFDVFSHARQHGQIHSWQNGDKALVIAEYGDWEYYAKNAGFDQVTGAGVFDPRSNSRQFRADGERGLRRQACNHAMALNDVLSSPAVLHGQWAVFDYARGYDPKRAAVGVMDIFRLPKFSYHFFRSQRSADEIVLDHTTGYRVFIASLWTATSDLRVVAFSNCEEVELQLNGQTVSRQPRQETSLTQHLPHPPFFFDLSRFIPGTLKAIGYVAGQARATTRVVTPEALAAIDLTIDDLGIRSHAGEPDVLIAHARLVDRQGTLCVDEHASVTFSAAGAQLMGPNDVATEAGIASVVLRVPPGSTELTLTASLASHAEGHTGTVHWSRAPNRSHASAEQPKRAEISVG